VLVQRDTGSVSALLERRILEATLLNSDRVLTDAAKLSREATATLAVLCGRGPDEPIKLSGVSTSFPQRAASRISQAAGRAHEFRPPAKAAASRQTGAQDRPQQIRSLG
jgi:hypothetical protein